MIDNVNNKMKIKFELSMTSIAIIFAKAEVRLMSNLPSERIYFSERLMLGEFFQQLPCNVQEIIENNNPLVHDLLKRTGMI